MCENQMSDEENHQSEMRSEEAGENQTSDEEIDQNQISGEETSENQSSDKDWRDEEEPRCIVSDPAHPHKISRVAGYETNQDCVSCGKTSICWDPYTTEKFHFYCPTCQVEFHHKCHEVPSKMIHPYHPKHPLNFTFLNKNSETIVATNYGEYYNFVCKNKSIEFQKCFSPISSSCIMLDKCTWCGNDLGEWFYLCLICNFSLDLKCAENLPPLTLQNPKSHHHSLSLFPRPLLFPCDACGLVNFLEPSYTCYQCNYFIHQSCIDLPRVIKITRHPHRLAHSPFLPTKVSTCRVCYKNVDIKYGQYSCNHGNCFYKAHSKCATHGEVWDGEELEWEPEEPDETTVIAPYKKVGVGLIEHFCHDHHYLKLEKYNRARDSRKQCRACMRSITPHDFYNCVECDYFLHEVCANLPRQLDHALHYHSLFLDPCPLYGQKNNEYFYCKVCRRGSSCWKYICKNVGCAYYYAPHFQGDVNCILVPECFTHESHTEHLLFISTTYGHYSEIHCQGCKKKVSGKYLRCTICEFAICFKCSTIPNELYYKFDEHPLSLCYGESGVDNKYWCEVCEGRLDPVEWFYTNKERCTTIHHKCLFGDSAYMKSGHTFNYDDEKKVEVVSNSSSRPKCRQCQHRCPNPVYFKLYMPDGTVLAFCSFYCLYS